MKVTTRQYATALYQSTKDLKGAELTGALQGFVQLLAAKNSLRKIEEIIAHFKTQYNQAKGILPVTVTSAEALSDAERKKISTTLGDLVDKKIELIEAVDPTLIGGVVIKIGDTVIDSSFKKHLQHLRNKLVSSAA